MTLHLTPAMLERAYELLRSTPPYRGWKLPPPDDVVFVVTRHKTTAGEHWVAGLTHSIAISQNAIGTLALLTATMAHEMIHMKEFIDGVRNDVKHGASFQRLAARVCRLHGFDVKAF